MQKEDLQKIQVEKKEGSEVVLTGELPFSELEAVKQGAITALSKEIKVDGFREGHVPENILIQKVGEMALLTEMAERALSKAYPEMIEYHELDVIGYPKISITKIAKDNPLGFSIAVATVPEITLPDYEKIAKEVNANKASKEVTDEEVDKQIEDVLRQKAAYERLQNKAANKKEGEDSEHVHDENCDHSHDTDKEDEPIEKIEDLPLPELTDEFVKTLGQPGQFETVADFKAKIKEHLEIEKAREVESAHRAKITDKIVEESKMELPKVLIDAEIGQMFAQMEEDLKRAQLNMDDYLKHMKKTKEELIAEWTPAAEKRAKLQLVLNEIAKKDDIKADPSLVDAQVDQLLEQYKDADKARVKTYVESVLQNEAVMKKLEETS